MLNQRFAMDAVASRGDMRFLPFGMEVESIIRRQSLEFYMVCDVPSLDRPRLADNIIATNWPTELIELNSREDFMAEDRIFSGLRRSILPVRLDLPLVSQAETVCELCGVYICERFQDTIAFSIYDAHRRQYALILSGARRIDEGQIGGLLLELMRALDHHVSNAQGERLLTLRELECLSWSAAGKSSDETATILELSVHTVNGYLKAAMQKLNSVTRTQAVAAAVRLGLI